MCVQEQTSHHRRLGRQNPTADQHRGRCSEANGGRYSTSFSGVSSGAWRPFSTFRVKPSSSLWIHVCVTVVSCHSVHALRNYRPQRAHILYESLCCIDRRWMSKNNVKLWNENWEGEIKVLGKKNLSHCRFIHLKSHMDSVKPNVYIRDSKALLK